MFVEDADAAGADPNNDMVSSFFKRIVLGNKSGFLEVVIRRELNQS